MLSATVQAEAAAPYHLQLMPDAHLVGQAGIAGQGPYLQLFVKREGDRVSEATFLTYSCPNAIACGSWITRWIEGRSPEVLARMEAGDLMKVLGGLSLGKEHCAYLAVNALKEILRQWDVTQEEPDLSAPI